MRVLVYGLSSDKLGGIETFLLNMNKFMSDDMVFDYVIEGNKTIHQKAIDEKGGKVFFIAPKRSVLKNILGWQNVLKEYKKTSNTVYYNMFSLAWIIPVILAKLHGYKVIIHAHNNNLHDCGFILRTLHMINRFILRYMSVIRFTNSSLSANFFFGNKSAELIYNAIDTSRFAFNQETREKVRKELNVQDKHLYGFSGRLAYQKNPLFLMEIFAEIKKLDSKAAFVVCGDGDLADATKNKAKEFDLNVHFLGNAHNIEEYYQAMDCYILPSRFEGLGIVLIEAQCAGLPCVASADVIPLDAKVTELLEYISLDNNATEWAELCIKKVTATNERLHHCRCISESKFNICFESRRLEILLKV